MEGLAKMKGNLHCFLMVLFILSACTQPEVESQAVTPSPTSITIHSPMRPDFSGEGGEEYSEVQIQLIQNDTYINQEAMLVDWWVNYWGLAENRPFHPETKDLHYKYLFDEENNAFVFLEASGEGYLGKIFALPIKNGQFMKVPPTIPEGEFNIPEGFGPLEISGGEYILAFSEGNLVRMDSSGKIVEQLNMETAQWETERFLELLPETLTLCREKNTMNIQDIEVINQKLEKENIDPITVPDFTIGIQTEDAQKLKLPSSIRLVINVGEDETLKIDFCGYYNGMYIVDVPLRRQGSDEVGHLKFAIDENAQKEHFDKLGHKDWYQRSHNLDNNYERLIGKGEKIKTIVIQPILSRLYAEEGGIWDPLLNLDPEKMYPGSEIGRIINFGIHGSSYPDVDQECWEKIQKIIIPTISIGVIY